MKCGGNLRCVKKMNGYEREIASDKLDVSVSFSF